MANRRMFSMTIIDTDYFLELPISSQCLYFHLAMRADDDGFISSPKRIMRMVGSSEDDFKSLVAKNFLIPFQSGVCVITHWRIHNYISPDRYTSSFHKYERSLLGITDNNSYTLEEDESIKKIGVNSFKAVEIENENNVVHDVVQNVVHDVDTGKDRLGKVRLGKDRLEIEKEIETKEEEDEVGTRLSKGFKDEVLKTWNDINSMDNNFSKIRTISEKRAKKLRSLAKKYSEDEILKAIDLIKRSSFLRGKNERGWSADVDWFLIEGNFLKILEGKYTDKKSNKVMALERQEEKEKEKEEDADYQRMKDILRKRKGLI